MAMPGGVEWGEWTTNVTRIENGRVARPFFLQQRRMVHWPTDRKVVTFVPGALRPAIVDGQDVPGDRVSSCGGWSVREDGQAFR